MITFLVIVFRMGTKINFTMAGLGEEFLHYSTVAALESKPDSERVLWRDWIEAEHGVGSS